MSYFRNKNYGYNLAYAKKEKGYIEVYNSSSFCYIRKVDKLPMSEHVVSLKKQAFIIRYKKAISSLYSKRLYLGKKMVFYLVDPRGFVETVNKEFSFIQIELRKERVLELLSAYEKGNIKKISFFKYFWEKLKVTLRFI